MRTVSRLLAVSLTFAAIPVYATITGSVMNADGQPIAGAKVMVFGPETLTARRERLASKTPDRTPLVTVTADSNGNFKVDPPKDVTVVDVRIDAPGYAPDALRLQSDDEAGAVVLAKAAPKSGTITANGKPVAGATVILQSGTSGFITTTDDKGHYTVPDPTKWAGQMIIIHPDFARSTEIVQLAKKDLNRTLVPGVKIAGKVVAADGTTAVGDAVLDIDGWPAGKTAADGTFSIDHAPKTWTEIRAVKGTQIGARANSGGALTIKLAKGATISGTVKDVKTQMPLAGADVQISLAGPRFGPLGNGAGAFASAETDAKGNYTLSPLAPGSYMLNVTRPNYMTPNVSVQLAAGQAQSKPFFATAVARVSGVVLDEDKRPVAAARVEAERAGRNGNFMMMGRPGAAARVAFSGPDGRFVARVTELDTDVHIGAVKKGFPATTSSIMRFASGDKKSGLTLVIPRGVAFSGRVIDKNGKPVSGVSVEPIESQNDMGGFNIRRMVAIGRAAGNEETVTTASDGTFTVRVKEGKYDVVFKREGYAAKTLRAQQVAANAKPVEVVIEPGVEVTGRVTRGGVGVESVNVNGISGEGGTVSTMTGPDGSFTLSDLNPGQMMVMANKPDAMIQEMRQVTAPAHDLNIEVPVGGRITGRVVDKATHNPITSFQAGVTTSRGGGGMVVMMPPMLKPFTSDDGTFVLENVKPGPTQVVAMAAGYTTGRAPQVEVEDGKTVTDVEVPLETGARVVGRVTDSNGAPISGVSVRPEVMGAGGRMMRFDATEVSASTDPNGQYTLDGVEPGDHTFTFSRSGYIEESKPLTVAAGKDNQLDATLSSGMHFTGQVVLDAGAPVPDATVRASSAAGGYHEGHTDANGMFQLDGLTPGHYDFTATKTGLASGVTHDVDIATQNNVRIVMKSGATISGHVTGLSDQDLQQTTVFASSPSGSASSAVDSTGAYRIDGAPNGTVRVSARTGGMLTGSSRSAAPKTVELDAGGSATVDIEFKSDTVIRGRVSLNGQPLGSVNVNFIPRQGKTQTMSGAAADAGGNYSIVGLDDGPYTVQIMDTRNVTAYSTTYDVHGSGTFDIDMHAGPVRGHVYDAATGDPIDRAQIDVRPQSPDAGFFATRSTQTDSTGSFLLDNVMQGSYQVVANKENYGQEIRPVIVGDTTDPVEIKLSSSSGVTLKVVDARDGTMLNANASVTDMQGNPVSGDGGFRMVFNGGGSGQPIQLSLSPGSYRVTVMAPGYARQTIVVSSPSTQTVALTPGGTLLIHASNATGLRGRLVDSNGLQYLPNPPNTGFTLLTGTTTLQNVAGGHYRLDVLDSADRVVKSIDVDVVDGATADYSV